MLMKLTTELANLIGVTLTNVLMKPKLNIVQAFQPDIGNAFVGLYIDFFWIVNTRYVYRSLTKIIFAHCMIQ